jgi:hypothetical protein
LTFPASNAADVAKILASDTRFTVTALPPDRIAIFSDTVKSNSSDAKAVEKEIQDVAGSGATSATAIRVPHGSAQKTADKLQSAIPPDGSVVVKAVDTNCILVVAKDKADPITVAALKRSVAEFYWQQETSPPTQRLFYVDATTVVKKLTGVSDSTSKDDGGAAAKMPPPKTGDPTSTTGSGNPSPTPSASGTPGGASAKASASDKAASTSDQNKKADATDTTNGNANPSKTMDAGTKSANADIGSKSGSPAPKPPAMQAVNDMLVYSNDDRSDNGIFERNRLMAVLDLPRPEVLMNIWSLQASSGDYKTVNAEAEAARELIGHHNDLLQDSINRGWKSLSEQMKQSTFFDRLFYQYITQKFNESEFTVESAPASVDAEGAPGSGEKDSDEPEGASGSPVRGTTSARAGRHPLQSFVTRNRDRWGWCTDDKYCLGFTHAFEPLRPTFTNLLIGIISSKNAYSTANQTVSAMETASGPAMPVKLCENSSSEQGGPCADPGTVNDFRACIKENDQQLRTFAAQSGDDCELRDRSGMSEQILAGDEETLKLNCFREQVQQSFGPDSTKAGSYSTTAAGLMRAAVADFLFNYKWATQYPHDFIPYDLTQSAQELNAEFNPLVLAFNRDVAAFTANLQNELQCKYTADIEPREKAGWFKKGDKTFINDGMLSVRGISGIESVVDTVTQSFFDATNPPSLTDLVKSVSDAEKNIPGVLKTNLTANEAAVLLGALNSVQPAEAKIGRQLKLDITPHALAGASSAELEVKLTAEEVGNPTRFTPDKSADDSLSRVAKHDVNTRVRVESLKLFEVSAFSALLQRPRSKFPIVPPLFEVPYFGSFIGWPLPGAKVYHRSTAIVSAVIVPTAADLAFGIDFSADRFCMEDGCHKAHSPRDFGTLPLRNFHKAMVQCFASGGQTPYTGLQSPSTERQNKANAPENSCDKLSLLNTSSGVPPIE